MDTFGYIGPKNPEWRASQQRPLSRIPLPIAKQIAFEIVTYDAVGAFSVFDSLMGTNVVVFLKIPPAPPARHS